ncbi:MAG: hypothetical protein ACLVHV_11055 [Oscillospiraceae bacterium]
MEGGERRRKNLEFLYETAAAFEQGGRRDLSQFLAHLDSLARRGLQPEQTGGTPDAVQILSIHNPRDWNVSVVFLLQPSLPPSTSVSEPRTALVDSRPGIGCSKAPWTGKPSAVSDSRPKEPLLRSSLARSTGIRGAGAGFVCGDDPGRCDHADR